MKNGETLIPKIENSFLTRSNAETVFVELDSEVVQRLHGFIVEGHVHEDGAVLARERAGDFESFAYKIKDLPFVLLNQH